MIVLILKFRFCLNSKNFFFWLFFWIFDIFLVFNKTWQKRNNFLKCFHPCRRTAKILSFSLTLSCSFRCWYMKKYIINLCSAMCVFPSVFRLLSHMHNFNVNYGFFCWTFPCTRYRFAVKSQRALWKVWREFNAIYGSENFWF